MVSWGFKKSLKHKHRLFDSYHPGINQLFYKENLTFYFSLAEAGYFFPLNRRLEIFNIKNLNFNGFLIVIHPQIM